MVVVFSGPKGVKTYQAIALRSGLRLYAKAKIKPNTAWTPSAMLKLASTFTGKTYSRGQYSMAASDLDAWIEENGATE